MIRAWDQEVYFLYGFRFEPCGCSYDGHWKLTWSLTSGPVGLGEVRASWSGYPHQTTKKKLTMYIDNIPEKTSAAFVSFTGDYDLRTELNRTFHYGFSKSIL